MPVNINLAHAEHVQLLLLADAVREFNESNVAAGLNPAVLVSKDGSLCSSDDDGKLIPLTVDSFAALVRMTAVPCRVKRNGEDEELIELPSLPRPLVRAFLDARVWSGIPRVRQVAPAPIVRPDFTIRWTPGWDEATSCWVTPGLKEDRSLVGCDPRDLFREFALVDRRQEADCLAAALTPLLSTALTGALPGAIFTAAKPSSGKSALAVSMAQIGGDDGDTMTRWPGREEFTKTVSAYVASDNRVVIFDNIKSRLDSPDLESVITSRQTSFRKMHTHATAKMRSNTTWFMTVNGAQVSADILRRCIVVLLDTERAPVEWTGAVPTNVRKYQAALVTLMCALIDRWRDSGCPVGKVVHPGFEEWSGVVSGILAVNGIPGMWEAREEIIGEAVAVDGDEDVEIVERIVRVMGDAEFKAVELWEKVDDPFDASLKVVRDFLGSSAKAGHALRSLKGRTFEGCPYLIEKRMSHGRHLWRVTSLDGSPVPEPVRIGHGLEAM